ncbi:TPA: VWA domain-containing protein [bacterium]|nr:VWA domain-containing protein [bacterium]
MSKKIFPFILLIIFLVISAQLFSQTTTDLIILLDSSQSMIPYYTDVAEFICKSILPSYLRYGDRFHILTFADTVQNPISQEVLTNADINAIVAGILLLYPLGTSTDLITALEDTWNWTLDLPSNSNKVIVMITDGMHAPLSSSPYYNLTSEDVKVKISQVADKIKSQNWVFKLITVPFSSDSGSQTENSKAPGAGIYTDTLANSAGTNAIEFSKDNDSAIVEKTFSLMSMSCPENLGRHNYTFKIPITFSNQTDADITLEIKKLIVNGKINALNGKSSVTIPSNSKKTIMVPVAFPKEWPSGEQTLIIEPVFTDNLRVIPPVLQSNVLLKYSFLAAMLTNITQLILSLLIIAIIIALIIIIILYIRSIHKKANQPVVDAVFDSMQTQKIAGNTAKTATANTSMLSPAQSATSSRTIPIIEQSKPGARIIPEVQKQTRIEITADSNKTKTRLFENLFNTPKTEPRFFIEPQVTSTQPVIEASQNPDHIKDRIALLSGDTTKQQSIKHMLDVLQKKEEKLSATVHRKPIVYNPSIIKPGTVKVEFVVDNQNRCIGKRNIKVLHSGGKKTIGGRFSDFFIFLYPFPDRIADVYYDGESIVIVPQKLEYFPDYDSAITINFDERVRIVNKRGKELFFTFTLYIPPYEKINNILKCVDITDNTEK